MKKPQIKRDTDQVARHRTRQAYVRLFSTDDGKVVLDNLNQYFGGSTLAKDSHAMVVRGAMRAVIDHIYTAMVIGGEDHE